MQRVLLVGIFLLAVFLRFIGTNPGFPPIHEDEGITHSQGIAMILEHSLDPKYGYGLPYNYPIIVPLINAISYLLFFIPLWVLGYLLFHFTDIVSLVLNGHFTQLGGIFEQNILGLGRLNVVFWGRYVTALFGVGVVWMSFLVGKKLFRSNFIGLVASLFVAINYRQVLNSHFGLPDIYNAFFLLVALYRIIKLWEKSVAKNYLLTGISIALYFSTKFQFFALPPLLFVLIFLSLRKGSLDQRIKIFFQKNFFLMIIVMILTALILNVFHIINWRETLEQVGYSVLKYRYGRLQIDFYSISYLYHIGLGPIMSWSLVIGVVLGLIFRSKETLFLLAAAIPFLVMMVYFTGGGFYTRNFITIIPILLIFSALGVFNIWTFIQSYSKKGGVVVCIFILSLLSIESLNNSFVVPLEYFQQWNYKLTQQWLGQNLNQGSIVVAHARFPLSKKVNLMEAKKADDYFLAEMQDKGVNFAIINLNSFQDNFFWWMLGDSKETLKFWQKPTIILNNTPLAKMILELKKYVVFEALNPWQAPDENFLVVKVPSTKEFKLGKIIYQNNFDDNNDWMAVNDGFGDLSNFSWDNNVGSNHQGSLKISPSGKGKYSQRFTSKTVPIKSDYLYKIKGSILSSGMNGSVERDGFMGVDFLSEEKKILDVTLSGRGISVGNWEQKEIVALAPDDAKFLQLIFQTVSSTTTLWFDDVEVWESSSSVPQERMGYIDSHFKPEEHLFLNSNGGM